MDVEGVALCRTGQIGLIQICTASGQVFPLDIATLGQAAFEAGGLKAVLESERICKVVFDCRADADALYHRHAVQLRLAYNASDRYVKGLQTCLDDSGVAPQRDRARVQRIKEEGKRLFVSDLGGDPDVWVRRPLTTALVEYATVDVRYLIGIKRLWSGGSTAVVFNVTRQRLQGAVSAGRPAKGDHMSLRDFSLGSSAQFLGRAAVAAPRCYRCGREGHIAINCHFDHDDDYDDGYDDVHWYGRGGEGDCDSDGNPYSD